jgi:hypothetical protein
MSFVLPHKKRKGKPILQNRSYDLLDVIFRPFFEIALEVLYGFQGEKISNLAGYADIGLAICRIARHRQHFLAVYARKRS